MIEDKVFNGETLEQTLSRDVHDIANSCSQYDNEDINSWVRHIISTFHIYNDQVELKPDVCPECYGDKSYKVMPSEQDPHRLTSPTYCSTCKGTGLKPDEGLRERIDGVIDKVIKDTTQNTLHFTEHYRMLILAKVQSKIEDEFIKAFASDYHKTHDKLHILEIEETYRKGFDEGVRRTTDAMDSTFSTQLEEAKTQERERILNLLSKIPKRFDHNKTCFDCIENIKRQALKQEEE